MDQELAALMDAIRADHPAWSDNDVRCVAVAQLASLDQYVTEYEDARLNVIVGPFRFLKSWIWQDAGV